MLLGTVDGACKTKMAGLQMLKIFSSRAVKVDSWVCMSEAFDGACREKVATVMSEAGSLTVLQGWPGGVVRQVNVVAALRAGTCWALLKDPARHQKAPLLMLQ